MYSTESTMDIHLNKPSLDSPNLYLGNASLLQFQVHVPVLMPLQAIYMSSMQYTRMSVFGIYMYSEKLRVPMLFEMEALKIEIAPCVWG